MNALATALEHHQAGRPEAAEPLYQEALAADPHDPTVLYLYGLFNFQAGHAERACELLQAVVDLRPDHAEAQATLAGVLHWRGEFARAVEAYRRAVRVAPAHAAALIGLANALRDLGDAAAARTAAEEAVRLHPMLVDAHMALGATHQALGDADGAAQAFHAAVAADPAQIAARQSLARALMDAGRPEAGLAAADGALEVDPTSAEAWLIRGAALLALHRPAEAAMALQCSLAIDPSRAAAQLNLGNAHAELDNADEAVCHLQNALAIDPACKEAHASLASVYLLAGRDADAERCAQRAMAIDADMVVAHQNLATILARRGHHAEAKRHRDLAYGGRCLFIERTPAPRRTVLLISTSESGNVPLRRLLPKNRYDRLRWVIEYADEDFDLPPYDVAFNAVGDPDLAGPTTEPLARFLAGSPRPVLNDPAKVAATRRDLTCERLAGVAGVIAPRARRVRGDAIVAAAVDFPVLIRPAGAHGGQDLILARNAADLSGFAPNTDYYLTDYHDTRCADGWWRKYRMIFVDRAPFPYHLAISNHWLVHYESAGMDEGDERKIEEQRFLENPAAVLGATAMSALAEIGRRLDLDYCGVDFTLTPEGRILIFEANATMLVHDERHDGPFAYKNPAVEAISAAFEDMIERAASA